MLRKISSAPGYLLTASWPPPMTMLPIAAMRERQSKMRNRRAELLAGFRAGGAAETEGVFGCAATAEVAVMAVEEAVAAETADTPESFSSWEAPTLLLVGAVEAGDGAAEDCDCGIWPSFTAVSAPVASLGRDSEASLAHAVGTACA